MGYSDDEGDEDPPSGASPPAAPAPAVDTPPRASGASGLALFQRDATAATASDAAAGAAWFPGRIHVARGSAGNETPPEAESPQKSGDEAVLSPRRHDREAPVADADALTPGKRGAAQGAENAARQKVAKVDSEESSHTSSSVD